MESATRGGDRVYRYGGDEFAVLLPDASRGGAGDVAERIRTAVRALRAPSNGPGASISVGIACFPDDGVTKDALVETADAALYIAKGSGLRLNARDPLVTALDETAGVLLDGGTPEELFHSILRRAGHLLGTEHAYLYLLRPDGAHLVVAAGIGLFADFEGYEMAVDVGVAGAVYQTGRTVVVADYASFAGRSASFDGMPIGAVVGVPLTSRGHVVGVLGVAAGPTDRAWRDLEVDALSRFAHLASIALENARLQEAATRGPMDLVTGLPTRERLIDRIETALHWDGPGSDAPAPISVMLLDVDRFKVINESLGHEAGDRVLAEVGRRICAVLGPRTWSLASAATSSASCCGRPTATARPSSPTRSSRA